MVEPASTSAASVKALGSVTSSLIGRARPMGIARAGSREDRLQAYRVFLDALVRWDADMTLAHSDAQAGRGWEFAALAGASKDMISAIYGMRLCAPVQVMDAADKVAGAVPMPEMTADEFRAGTKAYYEAMDAFLKACRLDLNFNYRPWQVWRWHKLWAQRRYLKASAQGVAELEAGPGPAGGDSGTVEEAAR